MEPVERKILEQVLAGTVEPVVVVSVDQPDWPVALANPAFERIGGDTIGKAFADVVEELGGRELALEVSEAVRSGQETSFPMEAGSREFLLVLKPIAFDDTLSHYAAYWRSNTGTASSDSTEMHHALLNAKRRIRDLSREDPVTGLLNGRAFREVFEHDWAVAAREKSRLSLVTFRLDEFDAYVDVFGRHASDSCLRRVGQAMFVALSHASEEAGVREFASNIATAVRDLGLHHPRSTSSKFVTVSFDVAVADTAAETRGAGDFLDALLDRVAE